MTSATRQFVCARAGGVCGYCRIRQDQEPFYRFHIEHVVPRQHRGTDDESNLALACYHCNAHKGSNLAAVDPEDGRVVALFHPRQDRWADHFRRRTDQVIGLTPTGRATASLLKMNAPQRVELRAALRGN